ncbi:MAG: hypothetical protein JWN35_3097 [Frankiales bacterium]|nr:hypothetical protein [Frankiales bacterium]
MAAWDRRTTAQLRAQREAAVRAQVLHAVAPFSPYWRDRLQALGRSPAAAASLAGLAQLPAVGERDVCPDGEPAGAAGLVLQVGESGFALHADGPVLRRALVRRLLRRDAYRVIVETDTRPTSYVWAGLGLRFPVASSRSDLDLMARAGARLWQLLGLTRADVVVSALPGGATASAQALQLGALGAGSPLLAVGEDVDALAASLRLMPATVLALPSVSAAGTVEELVVAAVPLAALRTVLLVGAPYDDERDEVVEALRRGGLDACAVLAVHVPEGHRLMWAECRESAGRTGLHTYPDLEVVEVVDPETGEAPLAADGSREVVVTQLGFRGSALLRWRTGDVVDGVEDGPCPSCGRTVPRVTGLRAGALVPLLDLRTGTRSLDARGVAAALVGRPDVADWRVVIAPSGRDDADEVVVHVVPADGADPAEVAVATAADIRRATGVLPTQVVVAGAGELPADGAQLTHRVLARREPVCGV